MQTGQSLGMKAGVVAQSQGLAQVHLKSVAGMKDLWVPHFSRHPFIAHILKLVSHGPLPKRPSKQKSTKHDPAVEAQLDYSEDSSQQKHQDWQRSKMSNTPKGLYKNVQSMDDKKEHNKKFIELVIEKVVTHVLNFKGIICQIL